MKRKLNRKLAIGFLAFLLAIGVGLPTPSAEAACTIEQVERCADLCGNDHKCFNACVDYCIDQS